MEGAKTVRDGARFVFADGRRAPDTDRVTPMPKGRRRRRDTHQRRGPPLVWPYWRAAGRREGMFALPACERLRCIRCRRDMRASWTRSPCPADTPPGEGKADAGEAAVPRPSMAATADSMTMFFTALLLKCTGPAEADGRRLPWPGHNASALRTFGSGEGVAGSCMPSRLHDHGTTADADTLPGIDADIRYL